MSDVFETPGVYIREESGLSLSISSSATAVPAIACDDSYIQKPERLSSWLDYVKLVEKARAMTNSKQPIPFTQDFHGNPFQRVLRTYFENGGGYCWAVPVNNFAEEIPKLDDVTLLVAAGKNIDAAVNTLCKKDSMNPLFAILDGPEEDLSSGNVSVSEACSQTEYAAMYYPWLTADWASSKPNADNSPNIPPSAAVAGAYCSVDRERGVWKAPANVILKGGLRPKFKVSDTVQGQHNAGDGPQVNMIRELRGMGTTIWGARTLSKSDLWRYVPVRRLFNAVQRDLKRAMQAVVFEPNSQPTWQQVRTAVDAYLTRLWVQGGLMGNKPEEAFFVQVGLGLTMTSQDIEDGRLIVKVGLAAVRPAEFVVLQFTQNMGQA
ncbi:phage tail sheath family protein [Burkholderia sp. Bp9126]|nr:phage tail sheath family protein [Burkholderia sp. Bp9126]